METASFSAISSRRAPLVMEPTCSLHPSLKLPRFHCLGLEQLNSHCSRLEPPSCLHPILEQPISLGPRPNLCSSSPSSLNPAVASDHLGPHHVSKPGADELPSSRPGDFELPPYQTRVTELSSSQPGAVDFPSLCPILEPARTLSNLEPRLIT